MYIIEGKKFNLGRGGGRGFFVSDAAPWRDGDLG
jgi:hypothetical protein